MTNLRQLQANRANARRSTGPKTPEGRAKSSQNARRHGLRAPIGSNPSLVRRIDDMARDIAAGDPAVHELAVRVAEAQLDVERVRFVRTLWLGRVLDQSREDHSAAMKKIATVDGYEGRALSRRATAVRALVRARRGKQPLSLPKV
jgi:hypothetical protein